MVAQTGCDAVMIGRTAPSNPWIFRQIAAVHRHRPLRRARAKTDRYEMIRTYFQHADRRRDARMPPAR